jgi:phosphoglycolate phosphatase-like HAD superfamily hydrolase
MDIPWLDWLSYRAGIFDVRGTLVDLDPSYRDVIYLKIIRDFGNRSGNTYLRTFNEDDLEQLLAMKVSRRRETLESFGLDPETFNESWVSESAMATRMEYSSVQPDAVALQHLKKRGVKLGLVTSAVKRAADVDVGIIKGKIGSRIFDEVVMPSYEPTLKQKPDPGAVKACVERLGVSPEESFGVGNSERDIEAYRSAGVFDILIDRGDGNKMYYEGQGPSLVISDLRELLSLVLQRGRISNWLRRKEPWSDWEAIEGR